MIYLAIGLFLAGILLITISTIGLRAHIRDTNAYMELGVCDAPSPDDTIRCAEEIGHLGWHRNEQTQWFGDAWECDHWADTQSAPTIAAATWNANLKNKPVAAPLPPPHAVEPINNTKRINEQFKPKKPTRRLELKDQPVGCKKKITFSGPLTEADRSAIKFAEFWVNHKGKVCQY